LVWLKILHPETAKELKVYSQFNSELRTKLESILIDCFCFFNQAIWYASAAHVTICKPVYICVVSDQVPGSDGVSGSSTGCRKDKIPGWVVCRQGPLRPPPQACGEERRGTLSGQQKAGWVYTSLPLLFFFYFPSQFYFLSPGRTV